MRRFVLASAVVLTGAMATAGSTPSFDQAVSLARDGKAGAAAAMFADLAHDGNRAAQVNFAVLQAKGQGLPQDDQEAAYWAWRARLAGEIRAIALSDLLLGRLTDAARTKLADRLIHDLTVQAETGMPDQFAAIGRVEVQLRNPPRMDVAALWFTLGAAFEERGALALREFAMNGLDAKARLVVQERASVEFATWCAKVPRDVRPETCGQN
ncbi:sel1 repeat family protein [Roseovarius sp.]|uniref:sel1 repeat family protein n=1 Tax=Roseovarius sp. TaxID=1486281 RepID=UPI003A97BAD1